MASGGSGDGRALVTYGNQPYRDLRKHAANAIVRRERLEARITREQKRLFQKAAELEGRTVTYFIVSRAQEAAVRTIQERTVMALSERDREAFVRALLAPTVPTGRLAKAAERHKRQAAE